MGSNGLATKVFAGVLTAVVLFIGGTAIKNSNAIAERPTQEKVENIVNQQAPYVRDRNLVMSQLAEIPKIRQELQTIRIELARLRAAKEQE